nr:hypothetical protein [Gammaproteobacteria bacterium]
MSESTASTPATATPALSLASVVPSPRRLRAELEDLVLRDLLGPRQGPNEEVQEERLQDRYLVGLLAPRNRRIRAAEMDALAEDGEGTVEDGTTDDSALPAD